MGRIGKKVLSWTLCLMMAVGMLPGMTRKAGADDTSGNVITEGDYELTVENKEAKTAAITKYMGTGSGTLTIPQQIGDYTIVAIGDEAFEYTRFSSVTINNNITRIGDRAFYGCRGLIGDLTIPDSVTSIGDYAFCECEGFTGDLTIPDSVTSIGEYAFALCTGFTGSLTIPSNVISIGDDAFHGCTGFTGSLTIWGGEKETSIGDSAFAGCTGFTGSLTIPSSVISIGDYAFYGCTGFTGSLTIQNGVKRIGERAFFGCTGFTGGLTIPSSVTSVGQSSFYGCASLTGELIISKGVERIGDSAFAGCTGFTGSLTIPDSVTSIGNSAFAGCTGFTGSLTIVDGEKETSIGDSAFAGCTGFTGSLTIPSSVNTIGPDAFYKCEKLNAVTFEKDSQLTNIGKSVFCECTSLSNITIPSSVTVIDDDAFYRCMNLSAVSFESGSQLVSIGNDAFELCKNLTSITIPSSVEDVESAAFMGCTNLETVVFEENSKLARICEEAFKGCTKLTSISIPKNVDDIGDKPFLGCSNLESIQVAENNKKYESREGVLFSKNGEGEVTELMCYPQGKKDNCFIIPETVNIIDDSAFYGCTNLVEVIIPDSVTEIGSSAFYGCSNLQSITLPHALASISEDTFFGCSSLELVVLPNSLMSISKGAFLECGFATIWISKKMSNTLTDVEIFSGLKNVIVYSIKTDSPTLSYNGTNQAAALKDLVIVQDFNGRPLEEGKDKAYQAFFSSDGGKNWNETCINAGTYQIKLEGNAAAGYVGEFTDNSTIFTISQLDLSNISAVSNATFTYDGTDQQDRIKKALRFKNGTEKLSLAERDYTVTFYDSSSTRTDSVLEAGDYRVKISGLETNCIGEQYLNVRIETVSGLMVSLADATYEYDGSAHSITNSPTTNAITGTTTFTYSFEENGTYVEDLNSLTKTTIGMYTVYVKATNPNYSNVATTTATLEITQKAVTIKADSDSKEYDGTPLTNNSYTNTDLAPGDEIKAITITGSRTVTGNCDNIPSAAVIKNAAGVDVTECYDITYEDGMLSIEPAKATIKVDSASKTEGESDPAFTGTVEGLVKEGDLGTVSYKRTNSDEAPGAYKGVISATYTENPNYDVTVVNGDFTIAAKEKGTYNAVSGAGGTYTQNSTVTLTFTFKRATNDTSTFEHFIGIEVDGKAVPEKDNSGRVNWTAKRGSVILELKPAFLDTLSAGEHLIKVIFDDGESSAIFKILETIATPTPTVDATPTVTPATDTTAAVTPSLDATPTVTPAADATPVTGDTANPFLWIAMILMSMAGAAVIVEKKRRRA